MYKRQPRGKDILYATSARQGSPTGNLPATLAFFALSALPASGSILWDWRAPLLLSAVLVVVGIVVCLKLEESEDIKRVLVQKCTVELSLTEVPGKHWKIVLLGADVLPTIHAAYFKSTFALSWVVKTFDYSQGTFPGIIVVASMVQFLSRPLGALLTSCIDMHRAACLMVLSEFILMPAVFFAVETKAYWIAAAGTCLAVVSHAMFYGAVGDTLARAFPIRVRYTGLSLVHQPCSLLVGGGTSVLIQWVLNSTGSIIGAALASACYVLVSLACTLALLQITGFHTSDLSTAECADAEDSRRPAAVEREPMLCAPARLLGGDPG